VYVKTKTILKESSLDKLRNKYPNGFRILEEDEKVVFIASSNIRYDMKELARYDKEIGFCVGGVVVGFSYREVIDYLNYCLN